MQRDLVVGPLPPALHRLLKVAPAACSHSPKLLGWLDADKEPTRKPVRSPRRASRRTCPPRGSIETHVCQVSARKKVRVPTDSCLNRTMAWRKEGPSWGEVVKVGERLERPGDQLDSTMLWCHRSMSLQTLWGTGKSGLGRPGVPRIVFVKKTREFFHTGQTAWVSKL
ncbi:hypothetical protein B0T21DRAFT_349936 [Apiosordaria backusii]|uniref:Uncharacterized protein n=1 Tax=Apiosordaria backusii TaxID=314023 RepID=A0AA40B7C6_9PEZI|nr:hypothetical protein B0T21DRAFT_349936 [Apiosordaria backusii]